MPAVSYTKKMIAEAKENDKALTTVDVSYGPKRFGGTIQHATMSREDADWFLAFAAHLISGKNSPAEAWAKTYGSQSYARHEAIAAKAVVEKKQKPKARKKVVSE